MLFHPPDSIPRAEYITLPSQEKTRARKAQRVTERTLYDFPKTRTMPSLSKQQITRPNAKIDINPEQRRQAALLPFLWNRLCIAQMTASLPALTTIITIIVNIITIVILNTILNIITIANIIFFIIIVIIIVRLCITQMTAPLPALREWPFFFREGGVS